jgi:glutamate/tyrosine decarboxylase-like PLP-dependent enzyme
MSSWFWPYCNTIIRDSRPGSSRGLTRELKTTKEKLREVEGRARILDPFSAERRDLLERVARHSEVFLEEILPADLSPEMSKHFRGLRLWLPLKLFGVAPFRAAREEEILRACYFYQEIQKIDGFEVGPYPDLSLVTYRYVPERGDANEFNERQVRSILDDGRVLLTSTVIDGRVTLRAAILGLRTHVDTVDLALEILREKTAALLEVST